MSIEALYTVRFGHVGVPHLEKNGGVVVLEKNGGVVVLETGRLFGGDTWYAYTGSYQVDGARVTGQLHAVRHFFQPGSQSAWGTQEPAFDVQFDVHVNEAFSEAQGSISRAGQALGCRLIRVAEPP